jgi:excisionase family DNA binding protein
MKWMKCLVITMAEEKKFLTTGEVAKMLGVTPLTVWRWCKEGKIKAIRTAGGQYRIPAEEVKKILEGS